MEFRDQLQQALGTAYTIERELGGAGMSRVFLAAESAIPRQVVLKTLPPDLAAGVNVERFRREIQLAGRLQHPHIVPILAAGVANGLPYYTMPLVEGESLRARLRHERQLPVADAVQYLRGVLSALVYAHERGVIHRDIKPDNILLSGQFAMVTDFGVAKALDDAALEEHAPGGRLHAVGTPAYMAPEQAAGDPRVDHRADLYAVGVMAYEMLAGHPPFAARTTKAMLAAQLEERPEPVDRERTDLPPGLARLVMSLLEKSPSARPQTADEVLGTLDAVVTPFARSDPAGAPVRRGPSSAAAVAAYVAAFMLAVAGAWGAARFVGLPAWVVPGVAIVMALGAPVILLRIITQRMPVPAARMLRTLPPFAADAATSIGRRLSWRQVALGGVAALALFGLFAAGWMVMGALGVGPGATLLTSGVLKARDRVIVLDFQSPASDSTLGPLASDLFRIALSQSPAVTVLPPAALRDALERMKQPPKTTVDISMGREIATREGVKVIVAGEVARIGQSYVVTASLLSATTGEMILAGRETALDEASVVQAIDRLSLSFRRRIGESLRSVNASPPLERVTTASLAALKKYTESWRLQVLEEDQEHVIRLLEEAVALDSNFAMAYLRLSAILESVPGQRGRAGAMMEKAYQLRERLPPVERYVVIGFHSNRAGDDSQAIRAFESANALRPDAELAILFWMNYGAAGNWQRAEAYAQREVATDSDLGLRHLTYIQYRMGKRADAYRTLETRERRHPGNWQVAIDLSGFLGAEGRYDSAEVVLKRVREDSSANATAIAAALNNTEGIELTTGHVRQALRWVDRYAEADLRRGDRLGAFDGTYFEAQVAIWFNLHPNEALARMEASAIREKLADADPVDRRYLERAQLYALAGRPARARELLREWETAVPAAERATDPDSPLIVSADIALAENKPEVAIAQLRGVNSSNVIAGAVPPQLARAYDRAGQTDSALAVYERYVADSTVEGRNWDALDLAPSLKRMGELYAARGDIEKAVAAYARFVTLWKNADPELQVQVEEVKRRVRALPARSTRPERR